MRQLGLVWIVLAIACDGGASVDAGALDASRSDAAADGADASAFDAGAEDAGPHDADGGASLSCGDARPALGGITGTEGLVIARDGTFYYSQSGAIGRMRPGGEPEDDFVSVSGSTVWGLALDAANETLFAGVPGEGVVRVDLTAETPSAELLVSGGQPNGLAIGPDGFLYYSDFGADVVRRVDPSGGSASTVVSVGGAIAGANGVAFEPAGTLLVASYVAGRLYRLTLDAGVETGRATVTEDLGAPDGVAVGADGTIFVSDQASSSVYAISSGSLTELRTGLSSPASLEFGAGALRCEDLYVAVGGGALERIDDVGPGVSVPWH